MQKLISVSLVVVVAAICLSRAAAEDGAWKMPNLNPFSAGGHAPACGGAGQPPTSGWKMPKIWSQSPAQPKKRTSRAANQPTTWNRMTTGTQNALSKTADAINPWDNKPKHAAPPPKLTGANSIFANKSTTKSAKKDEAVKPASWWGSDKKDEPKTISGFLSQPRP